MRVNVRGLSKRFGELVAVDDLSFHIDTPGVVGLLGRNGAGKTSTFKLLMGMLRPTSGSATVESFDCASEPNAVRQVVGYMPDEPAFYDHLTGRETLYFMCEMRDLHVTQTWDRLLPLIDELQAHEVLDQRCGGFSLGMRKKLALLVALAHTPRVLLLDEPTNGLDPPSAALARGLFERLAREQGTTVILSTHLLDLAERSCERLLILEQGRLVADGPFASLRVGDESLEAVFMRMTNPLPESET